MSATTESFDNFVRQQQERSAASKAFDYEAQKREYIALLEQLYIQIRSYLDDYINAGSVQLESSTVLLNEEGIGTYQAPRFTVIIGSQQVVLTPIGTLLIGSKGRVDVAGSTGTARLGLVDRHARDLRDAIKVTVNLIVDGKPFPDTKPAEPKKEIDWTWKILSPPPSTTFINLDRESFLTMILEISGG